MKKTTVCETPAQLPETVWIRGERTMLRPVTYADTEHILRWRNAPEVRDRFVFRETITEQAHEKWLRERVETGQVVQWVICEREDNKGVGSVYLRDIDPEQKTAEYGIFIGEAHARGKGYATEAARLVLRYAFDVLGLDVVGLRAFSDNEQAKKGYLAAGFRAVKELPAVESTDGTREDMVWMEAKREL